MPRAPMYPMISIRTATAIRATEVIRPVIKALNALRRRYAPSAASNRRIRVVSETLAVAVCCINEFLIQLFHARHTGDPLDEQAGCNVEHRGKDEKHQT